MTAIRWVRRNAGDVAAGYRGFTYYTAELDGHSYTATVAEPSGWRLVDEYDGLRTGESFSTLRDAKAAVVARHAETAR